MSWECFAAHLYGIETNGAGFLEDKFAEVETDYEKGDWECIMDLIRDQNYENLPNYPKDAEGIEVIHGQGTLYYVGYSAQMPYQEPLMSREEMDIKIMTLMEYLIGYKAKELLPPDEIYVAWTE